MAVAITGSLPQLDNLTTGSADVVTQITVGAGASKISFRPRANDAKLSFGAAASGLTDGGALGAAEYCTITAGAWTQLAIQGTRTFYITSGTGSTVIEVAVEGGA
jgi:hypothetical protein